MDRRSKYTVSARDKLSSIGGDTARYLHDNFETELLKYSEEYNVHPAPRIVRTFGDVYASHTPSSMLIKSDDLGSLIFHLTYENKKLIDSHDLCLDFMLRREVSICALDALNFAMQKYNTITILKLPNCNINAYGIMQIAEMLTNIGCVQDLNLDMNPNPQENFHLLCSPLGSLKYLSLGLCKITDNGMKKIANELEYRDPPYEPQLIILSLANNHITKDGAVHIGRMLRTNRSLSCLVLLGNRICDEGASIILQELQITTLKHEEIVDLRRRKFAELSLLDEWMEKREGEDIDRTASEKLIKSHSKLRRRSSLIKRSRKSTLESSNRIGEERNINQDLELIQKSSIFFDDAQCHPLKRETYRIHGEVLATGNLKLQYLDLSYNNTTVNILKELIKCLHYQNYMLLGDTSKGLLYVLIKGRDIKDKSNKDWSTVEELLCQRQSGEHLKSNVFREFVSKETEILRNNITTGYTHCTLDENASTVVLQIVTMLFHIAAVAMLTNFAFLELYSFYDSPETLDIQLSDENPLHRVFVYGTLKRGEPNHSLIQDAANGYAKFLGLGRTTVSYPLIIATKYNIPFLLKKPGFGHHVFGEIYDIDTKMLTKLDELEEHPALYERSQENVLWASESKAKSTDNFEEVGTLTKAWIYFLPKFKASLLESQMYNSYSNEGSHGLKYCENEESTIRPEDLR